MNNKPELLSQQQLEAINAPIEKARTLPAEAFYSEAFYKAERENIYSKHWIAALFEHDIAEPGQAVPFEICEMPLLAVRDLDGQLRVFHNIVPYDGCLAVINAAEGLEQIVTPYHGWTYNLEGKLIAIPFWDGTRAGNLESVAHLETDLVPVHCESFLHTIFVNLSDNPRSFRDYVAPILRQFDEYDFDSAGVAIGTSGKPINPGVNVKTNWKTFFENACINVLHEGFVHHLYRTSPLHSRIGEDGVKTFFDIIDDNLLGLGYQYSEFTETYGEIDPSEPHLGGSGKMPDRSVFATLYPNFYMSAAPNYIEIGLVLPDNAETAHDRRIYLVAKANATDPAMAKEYENIVDLYAGAQAEDGAICEAVQKARHSPVYRDHFYAPFWDQLHHRFNQLVAKDLTQSTDG